MFPPSIDGILAPLTVAGTTLNTRPFFMISVVNNASFILENKCLRGVSEHQRGRPVVFPINIPGQVEVSDHVCHALLIFL